MCEAYKNAYYGPNLDSFASVWRREHCSPDPNSNQIWHKIPNFRFFRKEVFFWLLAQPPSYSTERTNEYDNISPPFPPQCLLAVLEGKENDDPSLREIHENEGYDDDEGIAESGM